MHIIKKRKQNLLGINRYEFDITNTLIGLFDIDYESDFSLSYENSPIYIGGKLLGYCQDFDDINKIPIKEISVFRPLRNDRHADILIKMFEDLDIIDIDSLEIKEYDTDKGKRYSGSFKKNNSIIDGTLIKSSPSIPILKISIVANMLLDENEYKIYYNNLLKYLSSGKNRK